MHGTMGGVCSLIAASRIFAHAVLVLTRRLPAGVVMRQRGTTQPERARGRQETEQSASGSRSNIVQIVHEMRCGENEHQHWVGFDGCFSRVWK